MKRYKIDVTISETVGRTIRDTVFTFPKENETAAIRYAVGYMKLNNDLYGDDVNYFIHKIEEIA